MPELIPNDAQHVVDMIDNEGWPDALGWLVSDDFGDKELNNLIAEAAQTNNILQGWYNKIEDRVVELGADWYIG